MVIVKSPRKRKPRASRASQARVDPRAYSRLVVDGSSRRRRARCCARSASGCGFCQAADRHRLDLGRSHALQHAYRRAGARGGGGRRCGRRQERRVQYHHRLGRHLDGLAGHALFAGVARGDRRFDRDRGRCRRLRRPGRHRRLRQEHARLRDGHRAAEPAGGVRLRRHHSSRRAAARYRLGVRGGRRHAAGRISDAQLLEVERTAIPGPGSCGGMYTANTMASAIEGAGPEPAGQLGPGGGRQPKHEDCRRAGAAVVALLQQGIRPSDI
jgi:hypothetical protein